jgi:hypothetical protein
MIHYNQYRFDFVGHLGTERQTWIHLQHDDNSEGANYQQVPFQQQNEIQVAPGDKIKISFCIHNLNGFVDM